MLVEAWARVRPEGWKLRIVGPDEAGHQAEVERVANRTGITSVVEFVGKVSGSAKVTAYASADLFILPSYTENFGMAVAEALAHSLPVITTTGTPWSLLPERGCGWWVAPTVDHLADALTEATALDDEALRDMGSRGRELVSKEFSWQRAALKMKEAYQWVLGGNSKPDCFVS